MKDQYLIHREKVIRLAKFIPNKDQFAIDISPYGVSEIFSDPESDTIYRRNMDQLIQDTWSYFLSLEEENNPHYPDASYESIYDY